MPSQMANLGCDNCLAPVGADRFLFGTDVRFVDSVDNAFWLMREHAELEDWEPGANQRIEPTEENIAAIIAEKDEALAEVEKLPGILQVESLPISDEFVLGLKLCAIGVFRARQASVTKQPEHAQQGLKAADDLQEYRTKMAKFLGNKFFPQEVHRAFGVYKLDSLVKSIRDICSPLAKA